MTRTLVITVGTRGDVQPFLALANTLTDRGHDITFSTGTGFEKMLKDAGIKTRPLSVDIPALLDQPEIQAAMHTLRGKWNAYQKTKDMTRQQNEEIWNIVADLKPDIVVYSPKAFIASYAAKAVGATAVPSFLQPAFAATSAFPSPLFRLPGSGGLINRLSWALFLPLVKFGLKASLGSFRKANPNLELSKNVDPLAGYSPSGKPVPRLFAHSNHLVPKPADWGDNDHVTGAWFADLGRDWQPPKDLVDFLNAGPPPIYIGFGSMPSQDEDALARLVHDAIVKTGTRAIVAKGWGALARIKTSDAIHAIDSAPHDWLFPKCAAVVHHGGAGTTHEGLRWGRPTLVCPVFGDQPFWADLVHKLGAGPKPISHHKLSVDNFSAALTDLNAPTYAECAGEIGTAMQKETGTITAADLIERAAETGK